MAENTKIQWCDHTFNPWRGCSKVSAGCANCYAATLSGRNPAVLGQWGPNGTRVVAAESQWRLPLKWDREAEKAGERRRVFCASLADVFEDWTGPMVDSGGTVVRVTRDGESWVWYTNSPHIGGGNIATMHDVRSRMFSLIDATPNLDWLLVTKRPENAFRMWPLAGDGTPSGDSHEKYMPNVWLLTSVENQAAANTRIPALLRCCDLVPVLGLSCEPLLGPVDISPWLGPWTCAGEAGIGKHDGKSGPGSYCGSICRDRGKSRGPVDWVIIGGESGRGARPCNLDWMRSLLGQCRAAGVPCFVKQLGADIEAANDSISDWLDQCPTVYAEMGMPIQGELVRLRLHDPKGGDPAEWPEDVRAREFPERRGTVGE